MLSSVNCFVNNQQFSGIIHNISPTEAFIEAHQNNAIGQKLTIVLQFPKRNKPTMAKGEALLRNGNDFGVKFKRNKPVFQ